MDAPLYHQIQSSFMVTPNPLCSATQTVVSHYVGAGHQTHASPVLPQLSF